MMSAVFKGMSMRKRLVVLVFATLLPVWAQSQGHSGTKAKPSQTSEQVKARAAADITARLQARAIAEAAAQAAAQAAVLNKASVTPSAPLPAAAAPENGKPSDVSAPQPTQAQASAPMQALPAWTDLPPERSDAPAAPTWVAVPAMPSAPALSSAQPLTHATTGLAPLTTGLAMPSPVAPSASDPMLQDLAIAQQIHQGLMPCEMGASVRVQADAAAPGYFHVQGKGFRYRMYPVRTSTGALRLEDKKAGAVWLQLANKSMLMDQKKGRRVADDCAHPEQVAYGQDMKTHPPPSLFDKTGMGRSND
jgi:hypothetical protein